LNYKNSLDALLTILNLGGKITQAPCHISLMLNGLRYYSIEVTINEDHFLIQAFEQEASDLFQQVMTILYGKKTGCKNNRSNLQITGFIFEFGSFSLLNTNQQNFVRLLSLTFIIQSIANKWQ
jgi:hypothetical protein